MIDLTSEIEFKFTRSSGKGGQHVNKVSTRAEIRFNVLSSALLNSTQKELIVRKIGRRISASGDIIVTSSAQRSQLMNKKKAMDRLHQIIEDALHVEKTRIPTRISKASISKRLNLKKQHSEKKQNRKPFLPSE